MLALAVAALVIESVLGYPDRLFRLISHPVVWIGGLIGWLDHALNRDTLDERRRRLNGVLALLAIAGLPAICAGLLQIAAVRLLPAWLALAALALLASTLLAQRSLHAHVAAVAAALHDGGLESGRRAVSHIVGRDPASLDQAAVVRAAIESLAENFSDGVAAPLFWCGLLGLPGMAAYKAINTADSMIGHRTTRHRSFGWAAARLDDLVNLPAARLAAVCIVLAAATLGAGDGGRALRVVRRDASRHRSPNAGWPEAAMAGALGIRLAGPRRYGGVLVEDAWLGDGERAAGLPDLRAALRLYRRACLIQFAVLAAGLGLARGLLIVV